MRRKWAPSIVPESGDQNIYMVLDNLGRLGQIWPEADAEATELETVITDLLTGQYSSPVRIFAFNTAERWSEDVSEDVADELRRRCDLQMREFPASISDFVEQHETQNHQQLMLRFESIRIFRVADYLTGMRRVEFAPCLPTRGIAVPAGPEWLHEIKPDGYRLTVHREGKRVRLFTRNGHDWTDRYPLIVEAALRVLIGSFVLDGEAVLLGVDGRSDFDGLHSRQHNDEVQFYAFDVLMSDGDDLRKLPLSMRKASLARLLARRVNGMFLSDFERGEIGPDLFHHACLMALKA
jgi:ATP-dependent DNA ligase